MVQEKVMQIIGVMAILLGGLELFRFVIVVIEYPEALDQLIDFKLVTVLMAFGLLMGGGGLATQKKWGWVLSQVGVVFYLAIHVFMIATGIYYGKASSEESMTLYVISALLGFMLYHLNREETKEAVQILIR